MSGPASTSPIKLDASTSLIVVHCTEHDWYYSCRFHQDEAYDAACLHEEREHAWDNRHREARRQRRLRRVATAKPRATYEHRPKV